MRIIFILILSCIWSVKSDQVKYDEYKVYRLKPTTESQLKLLNDMEKGGDYLDFWTKVNKKGRPIDVMVAPEFQILFKDLLNRNEIQFEELIKNVQELIVEPNISPKSNNASMAWNGYYTYDYIYDWMDLLSSKYPGIVEVISGGTSFEGRDLKGVKISFGPGRRGVFIEGGIHAREWISPATVTYIINELLTRSNPDFKKIAESFDWYLFPTVNPDGYLFSYQTNRMWRKTRTRYYLCSGADANRNFDYSWGVHGTSQNPCAENYPGPNAFSEKEAETFANYIKTVASTLDVYLAFHSFSQILLIPYGNSSEHLDNYDDLYKIGTAMRDALYKKYNTEYEVGNVAEILYEASGISMDWVKSQFKVPITYTYELRDTGRYGFLLPPQQIIPNCEEVMDSLIALFVEAEKLGYFSLG